MNDFTKEELENILNGNIEIYPHSYFHLRAKIQHMIDNYCEHETDGPGYSPGIYGRVLAGEANDFPQEIVYKCNKCQKLYIVIQ